jgi:DNA-binding response OmpR family regulator
MPSEGRLPLAGLKALIVEDEPLIAMDVANQLRRAGTQVVAVCMAVSAAQTVLRTQEIDFAIVDFNLGREASVSIQIELERRTIPYVLLTAYPADAVRRSASQAILSKPANPDLLVETIRGLVRSDRHNA